MQEEWQSIGWQLLEVSLGQVRTHGSAIKRLIAPTLSSITD